MSMSLLRRYASPISAQQRLNRALSTSAHGPLTILFCGSDAFSIYSLRALDTFRRTSPSVIKQIDVLCRADKRVGRGLKQVHSVPIKAVSQELGLGLHQLDTFRDWTPPAVDLIVTASFGLLVPARILNHAQYGGLNVHPSLLPQFRGAAPIQHAIMERVRTTGVSVQTMHPTKFDHGLVLAQRQINMQEDATGKHVTTADLTDRLGPIGGDLLVESVREGLFLHPRDIGPVRNVDASRAPKITPTDRMIDWETWTADDILARDSALSHLWDRTSVVVCEGVPSHKRLVYRGPWSLLCTDAGGGSAPGTLVLLDGTVGWTTIDGAIIAPSAATIEGEAKDQGLSKLQRLLKSAHNV